MNKNPRIEWSQKSGRQCLKFTFEGILTSKDAAVAISEWKEMFQSKTGKSIILIWDCRKMKSYESGARVIWTNALKEMKSQIDKIWLISDSSLIRMGASVMGLVTSLDIKAISSESDIVINT